MGMGVPGMVMFVNLGWGAPVGGNFTFNTLELDG